MRVTLGGMAFNVEARGDGRRALVFLHHFGGSSWAWSGVMDRLAGGHRCLAPDLRGCGDSDAPSAGYAVGDLAADVTDLVGLFRLERYVLIGHSMGGKVAQSLATSRPPGLEALVLVAPSPATPEPISEAERARLLAGHGDRGSAEETVRKITACPLTAPVFGRVVDDIVRTSRPAWFAWLERGSREDVSARLPRISVPVLVVAGREDPVMPADFLEREVVPGIAGARMAVVPSAGHLLPLEAPDATAGLIAGLARALDKMAGGPLGRDGQ